MLALAPGRSLPRARCSSPSLWYLLSYDERDRLYEDLAYDVYEDTPGLQDGPDADFDAALEAYVKVCGGRVRPLRSPRADDAPPVRSPHPP